MKTIKNIYQKIVNKEYIRNVIIDSLKGKKYKKTHVNKIDYYVNYIYSNLKNEKYELKPINKISIHDRKKEREITISPYFPNKIYDYLIVNELKNVVEKSMYKWCVGNVKNRGKDMGVSYVEKHIKNYKYALKLDIKKFYDNIDRKILLRIISKKITDKKFINLFASVIGSSGKGLALGLNSSQWLSNYYLQGLDYFIKQKLKAKVYVRYVDDMIILGNNKRKLHYFIKCINDYLKNNLKLQLKENYKLLNLEKENIDFLGYKIGKRKTELRKSLFHKFVKLYKRMKDKSKQRAKTIIALYGWFKKTTYSYKYYQKYLVNIIKFSKIKKLIINT